MLRKGRWKCKGRRGGRYRVEGGSVKGEEEGDIEWKVEV